MRIFSFYPKAFLCKTPTIFLFFLICSLYSTYAQEQETTLKARLVNLESTTEKPFRYSLTLQNGDNESQMYALSADLPEGWRAFFKSRGSQVTALEVQPGETGNISFEVHPGLYATPDKYDIPIYAIAGKDTLQLDLQAVVRGNYELELTTPSGRLSGSTTEGGNKQISLRLKNTGTLPLKDIKLTDQSPSHWEASFDQSQINQLEAGETKDLTVTVKVPKKTIAGDYLVTFKAKNSYVNADSQFRMTIKTSILSGWVGIVIILIALGLIFYLIRKYGRR